MSGDGKGGMIFLVIIFFHGNIKGQHPQYFLCFKHKQTSCKRKKIDGISRFYLDKNELTDGTQLLSRGSKPTLHGGENQKGGKN